MAIVDPYRVVVTDDSAVIRGLITRILESDPEIRVVSSAADGVMAINTIKRLVRGREPADVMVLDIEMPNMDGLTAIPQLLEADPELRIVMASTLTLQNASASLMALSLGASDYVPKPTSTTAINGTDSFKREIVAKVKTLGGIARAARGQPAPAETASAQPARPAETRRTAKSTPIVLRRSSETRPAAIVIGSSTGGPQALATLLGRLPADLAVPILVTQHMPPTFTTILAQHLAKASGRPAAEAIDGEPVLGGRIYVAPGDFHMVPVADGGARLRLTKDAPENFCRPSVDPMFRGAAQVWGARVLGIILTGMGSDGLGGGKVLVEAGGTLVAQDETTSVVWGMPGAVATAGLCSAVLPLPELSAWFRRRLA